MPRSTEENEAVAVAVFFKLAGLGVFAPILDHNEIITAVWEVLDEADGNP